MNTTDISARVLSTLVDFVEDWGLETEIAPVAAPARVVPG